MNKIKRKNLNKKLRKQRTRAKVFGTKQSPRLSVFRSNKYTYAQLIDDENGKTIASISTMDIKDGNKIKQAKEIGQKLAEKAKKLGVKSVIFDRGYYKYHGRVEAVASGAREGGLKF